MKQVLQNLRSGATEVAEVPAPGLRPGHILVRTTRSLISAGTERMLVEFGKAGWIAKARQQPDKVRMVWEKVKTDGLAPTLEAVMNKLDQPLPLGYCNVGIVESVGAGVTDFRPGDRVASNGRHAEIVCVPAILAARVPDGVSDESAAFTVLGAIGLQGIRLAQPTLGETVVVSGLGLIGLMTVQLLRANGCRVMGIDFDPRKLAIAREFGAETVDLSAGQDPEAAAERFCGGRGVDAVIITAATSSDEPVRTAARMCRKRGRIVLVGVAGLNLSRADFYEKELTFQVSCSYGPGRYDPSYEDRGNDYPIGFVRWTEQRNFEAVLGAMAAGNLSTASLVSQRFRIDDAERAYAALTGEEPVLGVVLEYAASMTEPVRTRTVVRARSGATAPGRGRIGFIGAGNYAMSTLIPAFRDAEAELVAVACAAGVSGMHAARRFGIGRATTDTESVINDPGIDAVVISTRHDSHASLTCRALRAGKHVFVEKPLGLKLAEIEEVERTIAELQLAGGSPMLMVGFNRRFSPHVRRIQGLLRGVADPKSFVMTVNAGAIPRGHWTQDPAIGGGRILGEACHFVDLLRFVAGAPICGSTMERMQSQCGDTASIGLTFEDGSIGTIHYFANGSKAFPKERLEVFAAGRVLQLDNFRRLSGFGWPQFRAMRLWRQDKGQKSCVRAFVDELRGDAPQSPIPLDQVLEVAHQVADLGSR